MQQTEKKISPYAEVAKIIRTRLKADGYKCTARSSSFSMGNSVTVEVFDMDPDTLRHYEDLFECHEYGTFDGMTDSSGYKNGDFDGPQTKYLTFNNVRSDALRQAAWVIVRERAGGTDDNQNPLPENYADVQGCTHRIWDNWCSDLVHRALSARKDDSAHLGPDFWEKHGAQPVGKKPALSIVPAAGAASTGAAIEEHTHTKKGFQMFIVVLAGRVEREEFERLRDAARAAGGWYSRAWQGTPGGYAFKQLETAEQFLADNFGGDGPGPSGPSKPRVIVSKAAKFRALADASQTKIDGYFADRQENTAKRIAQAARSRMDGYRLQRTQKVLYKLADMYDSGAVPAELQHLANRAQIDAHMSAQSKPVSNGYHAYRVETGQPAQDDPITLALWALLDDNQADRDADVLRAKLAELRLSNIEGYFPTQGEAAALVVDRADVQPYHAVLEPEAGTGELAVEIEKRLDPDAGGILAVIEIRPALCEVLKLRGFDARAMDFLELEPGAMRYDRIIMNPPFEKLQDCDHVQHAYRFLKSGGVLTAVMSPSFTFNSSSKAAQFREWLDRLPVSVTIEDMPEGSFKASGTSVAAKLLVLS